MQHCEWDTERVPTGDVTSRGLRDTATPYLSVGLQPVSLMCVGGSLNLKGRLHPTPFSAQVSASGPSKPGLLQPLSLSHRRYLTCGAEVDSPSSATPMPPCPISAVGGCRSDSTLGSFQNPGWDEIRDLEAGVGLKHATRKEWPSKASWRRGYT